MDQNWNWGSSDFEMTAFYIRELILLRLKNMIKFYVDYQERNPKPCIILKLHFFCPESLNALQFWTGIKPSNLLQPKYWGRAVTRSALEAYGKF